MDEIIKRSAAVIALTLGFAATSGASLLPAPEAVGHKGAFTVTITGTGSRPMILIPGLLSSGEVWGPVVEHFASRYRLHVLTLAGFAGVPAVDGPLLPRVRDELIAYIREERLDRPVLVGHSLGGFLAMWIASTAPDVVGPLVAVDGVPFQPALMNPSATASAMEPLARQMRVMYGAMTPEQLGLQTAKALTGMMSRPADVERATVWASRSDAAAAGQALYELMTTDLRNDVANITSDVLLVAATKIVASNSDRLEMALNAYRAQVARIKRHRVVAATQALHFVMLDDSTFLLSTMDEFLGSATADRTPGEAQ